MSHGDEEYGSRLGYLINQAARRYRGFREARLRTLGVGSGAVPVLMALRHAQPRTQKDLADLAGVEQPSMAQTLARLEREDLIARSPDPEDGRSSLVRLTPKGESVLPTVVRTLEESNERALAGLSDEEWAALVAMLRRVIGNLEAADDVP